MSFNLSFFFVLIQFQDCTTRFDGIDKSRKTRIVSIFGYNRNKKSKLPHSIKSKALQFASLVLYTRTRSHVQHIHFSIMIQFKHSINCCTAYKQTKDTNFLLDSFVYTESHDLMLLFDHINSVSLCVCVV